MRCDKCGYRIEVTEIYDDSEWIRDIKSCPCGNDHRQKTKKNKIDRINEILKLGDRNNE